MIQQLATTLSSHGFRCLVPDLYKGKVGVDAEEASHVRRSCRAARGATPFWAMHCRPVHMFAMHVEKACSLLTRNLSSFPCCASLNLQLMSSLDFKAAIGEMSQAVAYLKQEGSPKV